MTPTQTDTNLNGHGEELLALVRNYATPQQWAAWLRVPLGGAAAEGNSGMVNLLVKAGADAGPGRREVSGISSKFWTAACCVCCVCVCVFFTRNRSFYPMRSSA